MTREQMRVEDRRRQYDSWLRPKVFRRYVYQSDLEAYIPYWFVQTRGWIGRYDSWTKAVRAGIEHYRWSYYVDFR